MKLLAVAQLISLMLMGAAAQASAHEPSVTAASGTPEDLSRYRPEELEIFQARCNQELKAAIDRGDNASAQSWATLKAAVLAEKQRRLQILAPPTPSPIPHKTVTKPHKTVTKRHRYRPARESRPRPVQTVTKRHRYRPVRESTPRPMQESTPRATPEEFPLPPGWPVGPKE
jgi:hypothetical protein